MKHTVAIALVLASWYGDECRGRLMANGKPFDPDQLTCASWDYDLGSRLLVTNRAGQSVEVTVTDRGPARRIYNCGVRIDLSRAAFERIGKLEMGHVEVTITPADR